MKIKPLAVSQVVLSIKRTLESEYTDVTVAGEISNLSLSSAGHYYFTLSDEQASVSCALFKMDALRNPAIRKMKNGDQALVRGPVSLYAKRGTFQIICKRVGPFGVGNLMAQFERLKVKLHQEGLFEQQLKKPIPKFINKVGVITALRGAALQDFLNVMKRRAHWYRIVIIPSIVQGDDCALSIIKSFEKAEKLECDVVVITRGGGSMEDLWGFNDENLVRRVAAASVPVISAVGHQVDFTLLDFVADFRCETPSTAAELITQSHMELSHRMAHSLKDLKSLFLQFKTRVMQQIDKVNPLKILHKVNQNIYGHRLYLEKIKLVDKGDLLRVHERSMEIDDYLLRMRSQLAQEMKKSDYKLSLLDRSLKGLNPDNVLGRGYSYIQTEQGKVISSLKEFDRLKVGTDLTARFFDGKGLVSKVDE